MTNIALSHIRDCVLLAASFAMILFVVLTPGGVAGGSAQMAGRAISTDIAGQPYDGRLADLAGAQRSEPRLGAGAEADR